jgi:hypothetical protein
MRRSSRPIRARATRDTGVTHEEADPKTGLIMTFRSLPV